MGVFVCLSIAGRIAGPMAVKLRGKMGNGLEEV